MINSKQNILTVLVCLCAGLILSGCGERPPVDSQQVGYRGTAMVNFTNPRIEAVTEAANAVPAALPAAPGDGPRAGEVYQNVQVLGDLSVAEFARVMLAISNWVAPEQQCAYCHADGESLASDSLYTKVVARKMLEMNRDINVNWTAHVQQTGVTCYTCHRGKPVPEGIWFADPGPVTAGGGVAGSRMGQNAPATATALTSLPYDPFTPYLLDAGPIRVATDQALPAANELDVKAAEGTYALMMHFSDGLGVNCTFCHNSRAFASWSESNPQRVTAWHGIQMARSLNNEYLVPLTSTFPASRLGPLGDVAKVNCQTCHQGVSKPLYGVSMFADYPELGAPKAPEAQPAEGEAVAAADTD